MPPPLPIVGPPIVTWPDEKLRLGGMALRNGLLIHGPTHWAAAVRGPDGEIEVASERKPELAPKLAARMPGLRGPLKLAEAMAVLPLVRRRMPAARLPFEDPRVLAAIGAHAGRDHGCCAGACGSSALREGVVQAIGAVPALVALSDRDLAAYHGVEHKAIAAYEQGVEDPAGVPKEHDRCGSNLIAPMMLLSAGGTVLLERLVEKPGPLARAGGRPRRRLARGRDVRLERSPPRRARSPRPSTPPAARSSATWRPRSRPPSSSRSGSPRWPRSFASRAHRLPADVRKDRPHRRRRRGPRRRDRALRGELRDAARASRDRRGAGRRGGAARRRRRPRRAAARRSAPRPRSASSSPRKGPGLHHVAYAVDDIDATLEKLGAAGVELIDSRGAGRHPREPRRLPAPALAPAAC